MSGEKHKALMDEHVRRHAQVVDSLRRNGWSREDAIEEADGREYVAAPLRELDTPKLGELETM